MVFRKKEINKGFKITIDHEFKTLRNLRYKIEKFANKLGISEHNIIGILISLNEAIYNSIVHGYEKNDNKIIIDVTCEKYNKNGIVIKIRDYGQGFDYKKYHKPDFRSEKVALAKHGRGIFLMKHYMTKVEYIELKDNGTEVHLYHIPM